jgi:hypothetical protein
MTAIVELKDKKSKQKLLDEWIAKLIFPGKVKDFIQEKKAYNSPQHGYYREFCLYTEDNKYSITAIDREGDDGYLGCVVSCRKARAGEEYNRGNDLPDGPFKEETWNTIIYAIVNYELVKLSDFQRPEKIPDINA